MFVRIVRAVLFLLAIIFTIPLAFDVGGRTCGLAFSLSLATFYFIQSTLRLATPNRSRWRKAGINLLRAAQTVIIPFLLIWTLNKFSDESGEDKSWVSRTLFGAAKSLKQNQSVKEWVFGREGVLEKATIGIWDKTLHYSTPVFQLVEGFCSLLVVQAAGQVTRYLVNSSEGGDGWMIGLLIMSGSIISSSVYFLWRITTFSGIDSQDAILIGVAITCAFFLCAWGIGSGRGNVVESSLLFAYITLCIYQIFTDYQPTFANNTGALKQPQEPEFPPLPPALMASYTTFIQLLSSLPNVLHDIFGFMVAATRTVTPSVIISLIYRLMVLYASARIIPAVKESGAQALSDDPNIDENESVSTMTGLLSYYSPSILIAVYTSLLMQHFSSTAQGSGTEWHASHQGGANGNIFRWINLGGTMALYAFELYLGKGQDDGLTSHWKMD